LHKTGKTIDYKDANILGRCDIITIRVLLEKGFSTANLSRLFGVTRSSICAIKKGKSFKWIDIDEINNKQE